MKLIIIALMLTVSLVGVAVAAAPDEYLPCLTPDGAYAFLSVTTNLDRVTYIVQFINEQGDIVIDMYPIRDTTLYSHVVLDYDLCAWNN